MGKNTLGLLLLLIARAGAQDVAVAPTSAVLRETLRHTFRLVEPHPGRSPISHQYIGRTVLSTLANLNSFDMSRVGSNSSIRLQIGDYAWQKSLGEDPSWQAGKHNVRLSGFDPETGAVLAPLIARWTDSQLRVNARSILWSDRSNGYGGIVLAGDYIDTPSASYTNTLPFTLTFYSVADDTPGVTNTWSSFTNLPVVIRARTRITTTRYGDVPSGTAVVAPYSGSLTR